MHRCEALILKTVRYRASDQVVTAFSKERGLLSFFCKGSKKRPMIEPLMVLELITTEPKGDLERLSDLSVISRHPELRENLHKLKVASHISRLILKTQLPLRPSKALYACLMAHLNWLSNSNSFNHVLASFYIKLLKCEGLIQLSSKGSMQRSPSAITVHHTDREQLLLTNPRFAKSIELMTQLFELKSFHEIEKISMTSETLIDIHALFEQLAETELAAGLVPFTK